MCFRIKRRRRRSSSWARNRAVATVNAAAATAAAPVSAPMPAPKSGEKSAGSKASWPSITTWPEFGAAAGLGLLICAVFVFAPDVRLLLRGALSSKMLQTPEDCIVDLMLYQNLSVTLPDTFIARNELFPLLSDAPFQHWDGPKTIGKSTEAHHLALTEKEKGNPVLYLSYKATTASVFEEFGACFEDSVEAPKELNNNRQKSLMNALGMFRKEGHVRGRFLRFWNSLFPSGTHPYAGDGLPILIVDDLNLATQEDARRWAVIGREGKFSRTYSTVVLTSPGPSRTNVQLAVSDIQTSERVTFRDFDWNETQTLLRHLGITDEQRICEIWHVVGGRPGDLASVKQSYKSTQHIETWREQLIAAAGTTYASTRKNLHKELQDDMSTLCKSLAQVLASGSPDRCVTISELARASGIDGTKTDEYWRGLLDEVINAGSVLWLQHGLCVRFETKHMQDFASNVLVGQTLTDLSTAKCPPSSVPGQCGDTSDECDVGDE